MIANFRNLKQRVKMKFKRTLKSMLGRKDAQSVPGAAPREAVSRDDLGRLFCKGEGIEIGAGSWPTAVAPDTAVHYADKRTPEELRSYFASQDVVSNVQSLSVFTDKQFDFVMAHHVLEHSANVIQTLIDWISLVRDDGILYLCLPNKHITPDDLRLLTPPTHFLLDYVNQTTEDDYESREHICSFLWGWIDVGGLQGKTKLESATLVAGSLNSTVNDLHWHTFNIDTTKFVVEVAAALSGRSAEVLFEHDGYPAQSEHRLVCKLAGGSARMPENISRLLELRERMRSTINKVALQYMEGRVTYSLAKQHKGKLFLADHGSLRWIISPRTLEDMGLNGKDYTYLEIGSLEQEMLGPNIEETPPPDRRQPIYRRLKGLEGLPGLELSPGSIPILEKDRFNVTYLGRITPPKPGSTLHGQSADLDITLGDKLIDEVLEHDKFNYLVSSHVIEHIPDFIQFFKSAAKVLRNGARLTMYVPDKRYTFDVLRTVSGIQDIEDAYNRHLRFPTRKMALDWFNGLPAKGAVAKLWDEVSTPAHAYRADEAERMADEMDLSSADFHCFAFTPESMRVLLDHVIARHVPGFELLEITETPYRQNEFIVDMVLHK